MVFMKLYKTINTEILILTTLVSMMLFNTFNFSKLYRDKYACIQSPALRRWRSWENFY